MILYFDSFITDQPLHDNLPELRRIERRVREGCAAYRAQSRLDIAKYTLASYAPVNWSHVLIKYELQDPNQTESFDRFVLDLFPKAIIIHNRSANQSEYRKSVELLESLGDEWIFYAPNNDHVMVSRDVNILESLIDKANLLKTRNQNYISIYYSHFSEVNCSARKGHLVNRVHCPDAEIIDEDQVSVSQLYPNGNLDGTQILHIDLMKRWFCGHDCGDARIIRAESLAPYIKPPPQIIIKPKQEICRHYDGYMHTLYWGRLMYISPEQVPPLFIPDGFFERRIKISYGYDQYREGWVNVNPLKENYSFSDRVNGTDLVCRVEDLPLFWRERISELDINAEADPDRMRAAVAEKQTVIADPWRNTPRYKAEAYLLYRRLRRLPAKLPVLRAVWKLFRDKRRFG